MKEQKQAEIDRIDAQLKAYQDKREEKVLDSII
jgi:hypothetical protein